MSDKSLNECGEPNRQQFNSVDPPLPNCAPDDFQFLNPSGAVEHKFYQTPPFIENPLSGKVGLGQGLLCDPMQTGHIVPSAGDSKDVIYRNGNGLRAIDEAVKNLFEDIVVIDDQSQVHGVPIIWGTQEKAVDIIIQNNVRKDNSLVIDRIPTPIMSIHSSMPSWAPDRYLYHKAIDYKRGLRKDGKPGFTVNERYERDTVLGFAKGIPVDVGFELVIWTTFEDDMKQILDQVLHKLTPLGYIRLQNVTNAENFVRLDSISDNSNLEPGDKDKRVLKAVVGMTAITYIPQPIVRQKAVLKTRIDIVDGITEDDIQQVIARLEEAVGELKT